jgi:hypothetical protein
MRGDLDIDNVVRLSDYRPPPPKRQKVKSQYEKYPLPFFNGKDRCTWDVKPSGNYFADCETGHAFALEFLKTCDGTNGWASLMGCIVTDMILAGPPADLWPDGRPHSNGVVVGFMSVIGKAVGHWAMVSK